MEARAIAVILAAGEGKRMKSILPKVLHRLGGRPLIEHVVQSTLKADAIRTIVVVGHRRDMVITALDAYPVEFVIQEPQLGTGHAMQQVVRYIGRFGGTLLVTLGDAPFIRTETLHELVRMHGEEGNAITLLTAELDDPSGYGRIVRGADGSVERIVEEADASDEERAIREINSGIGCYDYTLVAEALSALERDNRQGEYYLTDTIAALRNAGRRIGALVAPDPIETWGINDFQQLREAERLYRQRFVVEKPAAEKVGVAAGIADGGDEEDDEELSGGYDQVYHAGYDGDDDDTSGDEDEDEDLGELKDDEIDSDEPADDDGGEADFDEAAGDDPWRASGEV